MTPPSKAQRRVLEAMDKNGDRLFVNHRSKQSRLRGLKEIRLSYIDAKELIHRGYIKVATARPIIHEYQITDKGREALKLQPTV